MRNIQIFGKKGCSFCERATTLLSLRQIEFDYFCTTTEPDHLEELKNRLPEFTTFPQIFFGDKHVGGYQELSRIPFPQIQKAARQQ